MSPTAGTRFQLHSWHHSPFPGTRSDSKSVLLQLAHFLRSSMGPWACEVGHDLRNEVHTIWRNPEAASNPFIEMLNQQHPDLIVAILNALTMPHDAAYQEMHTMHLSQKLACTASEHHHALACAHVQQNEGACRLATGMPHMDVTASVLGGVPELRDLELRGEGSVISAADALEDTMSPQLTRLCLSHTGMPAHLTDAVMAMSMKTEALVSVRELVLEYGTLEPRAADALGRCIADMPVLEGLELSGHMLRDAPDGGGGDGEDEEDGSGSEAQATQVERLSSFGALAPHLARCTRLSTLHISGGKVTGAELATAAPGLCNVVSLRLYDVFRGDVAAAAFAPAIGTLTRLEMLDLSCNHIEGAGASALAPAISCLTNLIFLNWGHNLLDMEGAVALAPCLAPLRQLQVRLCCAPPRGSCVRRI